MIVNILDKIDTFMYYPVLIIILVFGGFYFTARTRFVQIRQFWILPHHMGLTCSPLLIIILLILVTVDWKIL